MFERVKNRIVIFNLVFILLLPACSETASNSIKFGLNAAPVTLDPRYATDAASSRINRLIYERLVDFDQHFNMIPSLANWQIISPTHFRFSLGDHGRRFHNGEYLDANDVKITYESVMDEKNASPHRITLKDIDKIEVIDRDTVDFHLHKPDSLFPGKLVIGIVPASLLINGHTFNKKPVGSGSMRFIAWPGEDKLSLLRLKDSRKIEFITIKDPTVRVLKLLRGEIDLIQGDLSPEIIRWLNSRDDVIVKKRHGNTFTYLGFNMQDPQTRDINIRRAIAYAINRDEIIRFVLDNTARMAGALLPPDHWSGHNKLKGYPYKPDRARSLLHQAGYDKQNPLQLTFKTSNNALRVRLATVIQYQLKQVGIEIDIQSYDWGTFYGDIKSGQFQVYSLSWVGLNMPDIFRYIFHSTSIPPSGANRGRYVDTQTDKLIEAAENSNELVKQASIYIQLQEYLHEQLPYIPLWYEDNVLITRYDIDGYTLAINGNYDGLKTVKRLH